VKKWILISAVVVAVTTSAYWVSVAFGAAGSGNSAAHRNDDFVVICHYDRNQQGPNAGPHTITVNRNALDHHLENHVKKDGFVGDDSLGPCPGDITPQPTFRPTTVPPTFAPD
jgi:hypothetical protein